MERRILDYALCFLNANWDETAEEDLNITEEQFQTFILKWQEKNPIDNSDKIV